MDLHRRLVLRGLGTLLARPLLAATFAAEGPRYDLVDLGSMHIDKAELNAINNRGDLVGTIGGVSDGLTPRRVGRVAFLYRDGKSITLDDVSSRATAVNERGEVVGSVHERNSHEHAVLWRPEANGAFAEIDLGRGVASAINSRGQVVGSFARGSIWTPGPGETGSTLEIKIQGMGRLDRTTPELVTLNDRGQVIGMIHEGISETWPVRGFLWQDGVTTDLGTLGGPHCWPTALNAAGDVAGTSTYREILINGFVPDYSFHAFLWQRGQLRDLGTLGTGQFSEAFGLNGRGDVVGSSSTEADDDKFYGHRSRVAFLYRDGAMIDLNRLIPPVAGLKLTTARCINDGGQIIANGQLQVGGIVWARSFLLMPR